MGYFSRLVVSHVIIDVETLVIFGRELEGLLYFNLVICEIICIFPRILSKVCADIS